MSALYDSLNTLDDIQRLIDSGTRESEVLEYKAAPRPFTDPEKGEIAKDISAMANSLGGTIIYGVMTHKCDKTLPERRDPIDVKNIETLDRVISAQIRPPIGGMRKKLIPEKSPQIMIVDVPESADPPHQSLYDKKYYRRSNSESLPMEHDLVALKFGRKLAPVLEVKCQALDTPKYSSGVPSVYAEVIVRVFIVNSGRRVARHIQLVLMFPPSDLVQVADRSGRSSVISALCHPRQAFQYQNDVGVCHPHTSASTLEVGISLHEKFVAQHSAEPLIEWQLRADEMDAQVGVVRLADLGWDKLDPLTPAQPGS